MLARVRGTEGPFNCPELIFVLEFGLLAGGGAFALADDEEEDGR